MGTSFPRQSSAETTYDPDHDCFPLLKLAKFFLALSCPSSLELVCRQNAADYSACVAPPYYTTLDIRICLRPSVDYLDIRPLDMQGDPTGGLKWDIVKSAIRKGHPAVRPKPAWTISKSMKERSTRGALQRVGSINKPGKHVLRLQELLYGPLFSCPYSWS